MIEAGETLEFEEFIPLRDRVYRCISIKFPLRDDSGVIYGVGGITTDITEHKQAEEALRESRVLFRAIFENAAAGIGLADMEGRVIDSNPTYQKMFGYTREELQGMDFTQITHPDDIARDG